MYFLFNIKSNDTWVVFVSVCDVIHVVYIACPCVDVYVCACMCVCACMRACVRARVGVCARARRNQIFRTVIN